MPFCFCNVKFGVVCGIFMVYRSIKKSEKQKTHVFSSLAL